MFYAIREEMDHENDVPTGRVYVAQGFDADVMPAGVSRSFGSIEEAKAEYGMVRWQDPPADASPDTLAVGEDE